MARQAFGSVQSLSHFGCNPYCRQLCFAVPDPQGRVVRMTHGVWWGVLAKEGRSQLGAHFLWISRAIQDPERIDSDPEDGRTLLYYGEPSGARDKLLFVAVKCLPRRFASARVQRLYDIAGRLTRSSWGEAWVSSAYFLDAPKRRGVRIWP